MCCGALVSLCPASCALLCWGPCFLCSDAHFVARFVEALGCVRTSSPGQLEQVLRSLDRYLSLEVKLAWAAQLYIPLGEACPLR